MWCWCSNVVISAAHATSNVVSAASPRRRRHWKEVTTEHHHRVGIQANMESSNSISSKQEKIISGSDVLWALQKRASTRKKMIKKEYESSSAEPKSPLDYTDVRPLCINHHWAPKLDELEKRLRHLSEDTL